MRNEIHALRKLGIEVDVLTIDPGDTEHVDREWAGAFRRLERPSLGRAARDHLWFAVRRPARYAAFLAALRRRRDHWRSALIRLPTEARGHADDGRPAICHTHFAWTTASVAVYAARLLGVPASITVHAKDIYTAVPDRLRALLREFDDVVTVCDYNVLVLNEMSAAPGREDHVHVVPCGVEVPDDSQSGRHGPDIDVISVGRLVEKKGFDTLVRATALVQTDIPNVRVVIVGSGPEQDHLTQLVTQLGLEGNVELLGARPHGQTLELMQRARTFCLAAQRAHDGDCDAVPVVIREAMARGIPVISTRVAGIPETVDDEVGWLVDERSPTQLADAIQTALRDDSMRAERGRAARARVSRSFTLEQQARAMADVFERRARHAGTPVARG